VSTKAVSWVLHHVRVEPITKMILVAMAENADETGVCWPSQSTTADKACVSLATVKRKIKWLEQQGVISVVRRRVGSHKTQNKYRLKLEQPFNLLDSEPVRPSSDPDFDSVSVTPSNKQISENDGVSLTPSIVSERPIQPVEGVTGDTIDSVTCDTQNRHLTTTGSKPSAATTPESVFHRQPVDRRKRVTMHAGWRPSESVFEQLMFNRPMNRDFIEDQIPGFVLYHDQTEDRQAAFDARFHKHVIHNWESSRSDPRPIPSSWVPDGDTVTRLRQQGIPEDFIEERAVEFVMYWREAGTPSLGWQAKFYDAVMRVWNRALSQTGSGTAGALAVRNATSEVSLARTIERMTDRSWAGG
jgi:hypothetical protein